MAITERVRSSSVDPIAGWIFIVAETANRIWFASEATIQRLRLSPETLVAVQRYSPPLWASLTIDLMDLAVVIIIGLGIVRGRAWALWIQALASLRIAFGQIVRPWHGTPDPYSLALFGFGVLFFIYTGLRILGIIGDGPRPLFRRVTFDG